MPDIKTALSNALTQSRVREIPKDWGEENSTTKESTVKQHLFQTSNNVTRETFNFVRDNPGHTGKQIIMRMTALGFNAASVKALLGQLARSNMVVLDHNTREYRAIATTYTPIKAGQLKASRELELKEAKKAMQPTQPKVENAVQPVVEWVSKPAPQAIPAAAVAPTVLTAKQVIETLSVKEAHLLYGELRSMFGGL